MKDRTRHDDHTPNIDRHSPQVTYGEDIVKAVVLLVIIASIVITGGLV